MPTKTTTTTTAMVEPPINRKLIDLDEDFAARLMAVLDELRAEGTPFKFHEGFRTVQRQQWLYGQGRSGVPYARRGPKVTSRNGTTKLSNHQGNGKPGSGCAADCYPVDPTTLKLIWPPPPDTDPRWERYASLAETHGLVAGYRWVQPHDPPHVELRKDRR